MNRLTKRNRDIAFIFGNTAEAIERLAAYEDTGLDPWEIRRLKAERDAAVRDLEGKCGVCKFYSAYHGVDTCRECRFDLGSPEGESKWEWRGPQQEET